MQTASLDILEKTQLPANQARAILQVMELEITAYQETFATKNELKDAFHSLKLEIEALRGEFKGELKGVESRLTRWVFTCILGQTAVMAGALYFALTHLALR
jgi:hypothetical protein